MTTEVLFELPSEYKDLRQSVRSLAEKEIAPFAHAVDEGARFPQEAFDVLQSAGLAAAHRSRMKLRTFSLPEPSWRIPNE